MRWFAEMAVLVFLGFLVVYGLKVWVAEPFLVPSGSMSPTLEPGDRILADKRSYRHAPPEPGDIIVFVDPGGSGADLVKRVVAGPGQTVSVRGNRLVVDGGEPLRDGRGLPVTPGDDPIAFPLVLASDEVFVVGDNPGSSVDSRSFGPVRRALIGGRVIALYWPPERAVRF